MEQPRRKKIGFGATYKPKVATQEDINESMRELFSKNRNREPGFSMKQRQPEQYQQPQMHKPMTFDAFRKPEPPQEPQPTEEPYWSGVEWEEWAYQLYTTYPDTRQFLPQWFIQAVEEQ